ncbi:hypothetical protein [Methylobacter sp.]|uniref:hypothetical protein n=1 Tax=Methylobacter sp. TaxID=2051955 RepID=UPI002FDDE2B5
MKNICIIALFTTVLLTACSKDETPKDEVPKVEDPHNIVIDGQKMTQANFLQKYCVGKVNNENCAIVGNAMGMDATKGEVQKGGKL